MRSPREQQIARIRKELKALQAPELPRPVPPVTDPAYQAWRIAFQVHTNRKHHLIDQLRGLGYAHAIS